MELLIGLIILGLPIYWIFSWYYRSETSIVRFQKAFIRTAMSVPIVYIVIVISFLKITSYYPDRDFSTIEWLKDRESRYELSKSIIENDFLIGKSRSQVEFLLGLPDESSAIEYRYYLGTVPEYFNIDPEYLIIKFSSGKVESVDQIRT